MNINFEGFCKQSSREKKIFLLVYYQSVQVESGLAFYATLRFRHGYSERGSFQFGNLIEFIEFGLFSGAEDCRNWKKEEGRAE